jgi:hypothetical protein
VTFDMKVLTNSKLNYFHLQRYVAPSLLRREFAEVCKVSLMGLNNLQ